MRWQRLLAVLQVPLSYSFLPGGLRGGGAVFAYMEGVPVPNIMWRMRIKSASTLEHYLQEVAAVVSLRGLPPRSADNIMMGAAIFDHILSLLAQRSEEGYRPALPGPVAFK